MKRINKIVLSLATLLACGGLASCGSAVTYDAEFTWRGIKATATLTPSDGGEEIVLEADVERNTIAATCEEDGKTTYVATVEYEGKTYTDTKESVIEKLGHDYGEWICNNDDTHSKTCKNDGNHVLTEDCIYKTFITEIPTSDSAGHGKIVCEGCENVAAEAELPFVTDEKYAVTDLDGGVKNYEITIDGNVYSFNLTSKVVTAKEAQRVYLSSSYSKWNEDGTVRLDSASSLEYTIYSTENVDVDLNGSIFSRGQATGDTSFFDVYDVVLNDNKVEETSVASKLTYDQWGKIWNEEGVAKIGKVRLNKGLNFISITSKKSNFAHFNNISFDYSGEALITVSNITKFNAVDAQNIQFPSTNGVATSGRNGIITDSAYLSDYTDGSNVRLNTQDYVEFSFESSEVVKVALAMDTSFRFTINDNRSIFETYKVFLKESGQEDYVEIKSTDERAYEQSVKSSTTYGEFHTLRVCELEFKAGVAYTLKFQARGNLHLESIWFAHEGNASIELLAEI